MVQIMNVPVDVVANVLDDDILISGFEFQSFYNVHFSRFSENFPDYFRL